MAKRRPLRGLDPAIKAELDRLLTDDRHTIRDVTAHLRKLGAEVSKSAVGRYSQEFNKAAENIRYAREMASALGQELGDSLNTDTGRVSIEMIHGLLLKLIVQFTSDGSADPDVLLKLSRSIRDLESSSKLNTETTLRIRDRALRDAAKAAEDVAVSEGLSTTTIDAIKTRILGIKETSA